MRVSTDEIRPTRVTIYNTATAGAGWTAVATGLRDVATWRLSERSGTEFRYCFDGVGATYMTSYGLIQRDTAISAVYVQRVGAVDITMELECWQP